MKTHHLFIAIAVACLWGFNFSVIKLGVDEMDPLMLAGFRFTFAALPAVFFIAKPQVPLRILALYGLTFGVGVWGALTLAIDFGVSAGMASLILQSSAFISVVFGVLFLNEKLNAIRISGLLVSILGLAFIFTLTDGSVTIIGMLFAFIAAISLSLVGLIIKKNTIKDMFAFVVWSCLFAPIPLFVLSIVMNGQEAFVLSLSTVSGLGLFSAMFQAYPVTLLGYWLWNKLIALYPMSTMAPLTLLVPVFGFMGSVIFYNETLGATKLSACLFIIMGIVIGLLEPWIKEIKSKKLSNKYG